MFDRSWHGRLLVERVEGFATPCTTSDEEIRRFRNWLTRPLQR